MPRLFDDIIMLREYRIEDLKPMNDFTKDQNVTDNLSDIFLKPHTLKNTEEFLNSVLNNKNNDLHYIIADINTEEYMGQIDIWIDWINRIGTMGIVIPKPENQNRKIGQKAIHLLLKYAFNRANLNKIELDVHSNNLRAINCYKKCGFIEEGRIREKIFRNGKFIDLFKMGILKREYDVKGCKNNASD